MVIKRSFVPRIDASTMAYSISETDAGMDIDTDEWYYEYTNEGGTNNGRKMGDNIRGRISAKMPGEQSTAGTGEYQSTEAGISAGRRTEEMPDKMYSVRIVKDEY